VAGGVITLLPQPEGALSSDEETTKKKKKKDKKDDLELGDVDFTTPLANEMIPEVRQRDGDKKKKKKGGGGRKDKSDKKGKKDKADDDDDDKRKDKSKKSKDKSDKKGKKEKKETKEKESSNSKKSSKKNSSSKKEAEGANLIDFGDTPSPAAATGDAVGDSKGGQKKSEKSSKSKGKSKDAADLPAKKSKADKNKDKDKSSGGGKTKKALKAVKDFAAKELSLSKFRKLMKKEDLKWYPGEARIQNKKGREVTEVAKLLSKMLSAYVVETLEDEGNISLYCYNAKKKIHFAVLAQLASSSSVSVTMKCTDKSTLSKVKAELGEARL